jgi:hypothetical protein
VKDKRSDDDIKKWLAGLIICQKTSKVFASNPFIKITRAGLKFLLDPIGAVAISISRLPNVCGVED